MQMRFDRGTLILDPRGAELDPAQLPGVAWDPRVEVWRAPACRYAELASRLARAGVRLPDMLGPAAPSASSGLPELRWYQDAALAAWAAAGRRGVVALPTGAGKTVVALAAIARLGVPALCLVPTRVLLEQWMAAVERAGGARPGQLGDGEHRIARVTVATYASAVTWAPRIGDRFGLVVVDEAHHVGAGCPREVLEMLIAPARLGLTATPPEGPAAAALARDVGPTVYALAIDDLVGDALADFELIAVPVRFTTDERARYRALRERFTAAFAAFQRAAPGSTWEGFVTAAMRSAEGRAAVAAWRASRALLAYPDGKARAVRELLARHADARTLLFTADNATAYAIAREWLIPPITHEIARAERTAMLARFRAGEARAIVSAQVLDEGLDVPDAEVAVIVGGSASARRHVQRIGRVLRPRAGKRARVYELVVAGTAELRQARDRRAGLAS